MKADCVAWAALINAYAKRSDADGALALLRELAASGLQCKLFWIRACQPVVDTALKKMCWWREGRPAQAKLMLGS